VTLFTDAECARALAVMIAKFESTLFGQVRDHLQPIARLDAILLATQSDHRLDPNDYRRAFGVRRLLQRTTICEMRG
jgi:hypothetical protein